LHAGIQACLTCSNPSLLRRCHYTACARTPQHRFHRPRPRAFEHDVLVHVADRALRVVKHASVRPGAAHPTGEFQSRHAPLIIGEVQHDGHGICTDTGRRSRWTCRRSPRPGRWVDTTPGWRSMPPDEALDAGAYI
jgi:hypothetical protein